MQDKVLDRIVEGRYFGAVSGLVSFLYPLPAPRRTAGAVFLWWESRRLSYNLIVGATGCATVTVISLFGALAGSVPRLEFLVFGSTIYGVLANVCYCLGPLTELALDRFLGDRGPRAGPVLFRQGLLFSVGLTLFPIALAGIALVARLVKGIILP